MIVKYDIIVIQANTSWYMNFNIVVSIFVCFLVFHLFVFFAFINHKLNFYGFRSFKLVKKDICCNLKQLTKHYENHPEVFYNPIQSEKRGKSSSSV